METITIPKNDLKNLLHQVVHEELEQFFPKYEFVSDSEQKEIEKLYPTLLDDDIIEDDLVEL